MILADAKQEQAERDALERKMDALVGKQAPKFHEAGKWLNSEPLTWDALRGKVVLLEFFHHGCGPCHNDLPVLSELHGKDRQDRPVVIGVHAASSRLEPIQELLKEFDVQYPVYVDSPATKPWGSLFSRCEICAIPHTFLIARDGTIAAHGRLSEMLDKATELLQDSP